MEQHNNDQSSGHVEDHSFELISPPPTPSPSSSFYAFTSDWTEGTQDSPAALEDDGHDLPDYGDFEVLSPMAVPENASGPENDYAAAASAIEPESEDDFVYAPKPESHEARKQKQGARIILQARRRRLQACRRAIQDVVVVAGGAHVKTLAAVRSSRSSLLGRSYSSSPLAVAQARRRRKNAYPSPWALLSPKEEKEYDADCESDTDVDKESHLVPDDCPPLAQSALRAHNRLLGQIRIQKQVNERVRKRLRRIAMKGCERYESALQRSLRRELTVLTEEERALHAEIEEAKENDEVEAEMGRCMESTSDEEEDGDEGRKGCGCFKEAYARVFLGGVRILSV